MYTITLGPLTLPTSYLLMLASLLLAAAVAYVDARPRKLPIAGVLSDAALAGLLVGRGAFVLLWWKQYSAAPWSMIDIRDGGVAPWPALAAGLAVVAWRCRRDVALRRPLAIGIATGLLMWQYAGGAALSSSPASARRPELALTALDGGSTTLAAAARGKPVVVNLWASWCPPCRQEMPMLVEAQAKVDDVAFVFVNQGESANDAGSFVARQAAMSNVLLDPYTEVGRAVGSSAMPTTLFYDATGKLVDMHIGVLSAATLASKLEKLRAAAPR